MTDAHRWFARRRLVVLSVAFAVLSSAPPARAVDDVAAPSGGDAVETAVSLSATTDAAPTAATPGCVQLFKGATARSAGSPGECVYYTGTMTVCGDPGQHANCATSTQKNPPAIGDSTITGSTTVSQVNGSVTVSATGLPANEAYVIKFQGASTYPLVYCVADGVTIGTANSDGDGNFGPVHLATTTSPEGVGEVCMVSASATDDTGNGVPVGVVGGVGHLHAG